MSKSNYFSQRSPARSPRQEHSSSHLYHSSSRTHRSPSRTHRSPSRTRRSPSRSYGPSSRPKRSTARVDSSYRPNQSSDRQQFQQQQIIDKVEENEQLREQYRSFEVPTSIYKVIFINKYTSMEEMNLLVNHVQSCNQFTIDTESEKSNGELALIQIQTLPQRLPTFVILIELAHLPAEDSSKYMKIKNYFDLVFRLGNELYSWGDMENELCPIKYYNLIEWPLESSMIDIQPHFGNWYERTRILQESCCLMHHRHDANIINDNPLKCECYEPGPYNQGQLWSLQNALLYSTHLFIDKSSRLNYWAGGLTNKNTTLSSSRRKNMINYAVNDVLATTILIRPILEKWSFEMVQKMKIEDFYVQFKSTPPPHVPQKIKKIKKNVNNQKFINALFGNGDLEPISDDEIYLNQLVEPAMNDYHLEEPVKNDDVTHDIIQNLDAGGGELQLEIPTADVIMNDIINIDGGESVDSHIVVVNEVEHPPEQQQQQQRNRKRRSIQGKQRKNKKRNTKLRLTRFKYYFTRSYYYKFKSKMIRKLLRRQGVQFRHIKKGDDQVVIGVKSDEARRDYEETLPYDCFNKKNYEMFMYH